MTAPKNAHEPPAPETPASMATGFRRRKWPAAQEDSDKEAQAYLSGRQQMLIEVLDAVRHQGFVDGLASGDQ